MSDMTKSTVKAELADMEKKEAKLKEFRLSSDFSGLSEIDQRLVIEQGRAMHAYVNALEARMAQFKDDAGG